MVKFHIPKEKFFLLLNHDESLLKGGYRYRSSIMNSPKSNKSPKKILSAGSTLLPAQPRTEGREIVLGLSSQVGGLSTTELGSTRKKYFFVVNSMGIPIKQGDISYLAASPSSAAVKAFYAWWRTSKQGSKCVDRSSIVDYKTSLVPPELLQHLMAMKTDKITQEDKKEYVKQFLCIDSQKIDRQILIRIGAVGGKSSVRAYLVGYKKNLSPNPLEVLNKMVVIASASPIPHTSIVPPNVVEFEVLV